MAVIGGASFTICLLLSLALVVTADYYTPQSPPIYKPPVKKPTHPSPVYTPPVYVPPVKKPTHPSPVYTPPVYVPPVKKTTHPSPVYTPPVYVPPIKKPTHPSPVYTPPVYVPPVKKPTHPSPVYTPPVYVPPVKKPTHPSPVYTPPVKKPTQPPPVYTPPVYVPPVYKPKPGSKTPSTSYAPPSKYAPKPYTYVPPVKPYVPHVKITVAIDGVIFCKNGYNTYPIKGAKAKLVCSEVDSYGKPKEVVIYSKMTDEKGYFYLSVTEMVKDIAVCKVKLHSSPLTSCNNPTNVNKGLTGVPLSLYHYKSFSDKKLNLYSVGPFYYTGSKY